MGVLHSTLQAEQNFPISIRSFFFFFPLEPVGEIHIEVHTKDGYKKTKKIYILAAITNCIKQQ